jgi:hypothetical protein
LAVYGINADGQARWQAFDYGDKCGSVRFSGCCEFKHETNGKKEMGKLVNEYMLKTFCALTVSGLLPRARIPS